MRLVPVFETSDLTLLPVVKSLLDDAGIDYVVQGEEALGLLPLGPFGRGIRKHGVSAIVLVAEEEAEEAKALLKDPSGMSDSDSLPGSS